MQSISKVICFSYRHYFHRLITKNELRQGMTKTSIKEIIEIKTLEQ